MARREQRVARVTMHRSGTAADRYVRTLRELGADEEVIKEAEEARDALRGEVAASRSADPAGTSP